MKVTKIICDRCGEEITGIPFWIQTGADGDDEDGFFKDRDFCPDCIESMRAFMLLTPLEEKKPKAIVKKIGRPKKEEER